MGKIVVGCWDCDYCGADRISGEIKICPNCGKPRGKDIKFYMAGPKNYVEDPDKVSAPPAELREKRASSITLRARRRTARNRKSGKR